jgi:hypothetical protein
MADTPRLIDWRTGVASPIKTNGADLGVVGSITPERRRRPIDGGWSRTGYKPPTIIEGPAVPGHRVEHTRSTRESEPDGVMNEIIEDAKAHRRKAIC